MHYLAIVFYWKNSTAEWSDEILPDAPFAMTCKKEKSNRDSVVDAYPVKFLLFSNQRNLISKN